MERWRQNAIKCVRQVFCGMLNYLWAGMMIIGILWGTFRGQLSVVVGDTLQSSKEAATLCIATLRVMSLWAGVLKIGHRSDLVDQLAGRMSPSFIFLFPRLSPQGEARGQITIDMITNILGLGWAAVPAGIRVMEELKKVEKNRGEYEDGIADNGVCTLLITNTSSLQLIPMNIITYRGQYGNMNLTTTVGPALVATFLSIVVAVIFCEVMGRKCNL